MALRELKTSKKIVLSILSVFFIFVLLTTDYITALSIKTSLLQKSFQKNYLIYSGFDEKQLSILQKLEIPQTYVFKGHQFDKDIFFHQQKWNSDDDVYSLDDLHLELFQIEGRLPQKNHELLINDQIFLYKQEINSEIEMVEESFKIGDDVMIQGEVYHIVGQLTDNEKIRLDQDGYTSLSYIPKGFYMYPQDYDYLFLDDSFYEVRIFYNSQTECAYIQDVLQETFFMDAVWNSDDMLNFLKNESSFQNVSIPHIEYYMIPFLGMMIFCFFLNRHHMINVQQDYVLYHLLGMTKKDIYIKEMSKVFLMSSSLIIGEVIWLLLLSLYHRCLMFSKYYLLMSLLVIVISNFFIFVCPIFGVLHLDVDGRSIGGDF